MAAKNVLFYNENTGKKTMATTASPNTKEACARFDEWLYSQYPEFTHAEYKVYDDGVSDWISVRTVDLKTHEERTEDRLEEL